MADKKVTPPLGAYPQPQPPQGPFLPAPPQHAAPQYGVAGGSPYGVTFGGAGAGAGGAVYAPPPYDQLQHHQIPALTQQLPQMYSPAAAMYAAAAAGYPGYIGYPVQYYPYYPVQPSIQPLRPTIMIPQNGFEAGGRFEGLAQTLLPPAPPTCRPRPPTSPRCSRTKCCGVSYPQPSTGEAYIDIAPSHSYTDTHHHHI